MTPAGQTIPAAAADDMTLAADEVTGMKVLHIASELDNLANKLVADDESDRNRLARPRVPLMNVEVGSADSRHQDANQNVIRCDRRYGNVFEPKPRLVLALYDCFQKKNTFLISA